MKKTILITGSSRGIGLGIAQKFFGCGNVVLNCVENADMMAEVISQSGKEDILGIRADVSDYEDCRRMFSQIEDTFGSVDILINNAGISYVGLLQDMEPDEWSRVINVNLVSVINTSHLALPHMIRNHGGCIINISSVWGNYGASCEAVYSASKGGVNAFTKALAKEAGPSGIRVNAISCGVIDTQMNQWLTDIEKEDLISQIPLGRFGYVEEIAELAFYLASEQASYITGQIISADGGM